MRTRFKLLFTIFLFSLISLTLFAQSFDELWDKYNEANKKGLPQTAIKELDAIYQKAIKENEPVQALKATFKKIVNEGLIQGNKPEEKIMRLEEFIKTADKQVQPMLKIVLAKWYFHYYTRNRDRFIKRSRTSENTDLNDFQTWDLPRLFAYVGKLYESVLDQEAELTKIPLETYYGFIAKGNLPADLCTNLFEFFAHQALDFYNNEDQTTAKPQYAYEINDDSKVFDSLDDFLAWNPEITDKDSPNYKALKVYQRLLSLNKKNNNRNALIFNNISRIKWAYRTAVGQEKEERYLAALKKIISDNPDNSYTSEAIYQIASHYNYKQDYIKALEYAEMAFKKWPNTQAGLLSQNLINQIKLPYLDFLAEETICSTTNQISIKYTNIDHAYFKVFKRTEEELYNNKDRNPDRLDYDTSLKDFLSSRELVKSFDISLEPGNDYKTKNKIVDLPKLDKGFYWLVCSMKSDFSAEGNMINYSSLQITDLAIISKSFDNKGDLQFFVVDSVTGKPVEGAEITIYEYILSLNDCKKTAYGKTDNLGSTKIEVSNSRFLVLCKYKGDKIYDKIYFDNYRDYCNNTKYTYIFTDRAIYRPGQTIFFKIVSARYDGKKDEYYVSKNSPIEVTLRDPNRKEVSSLKLTTNEFGSCTGTFVVPTDRLTGNYTISTSPFNSSNTIKVEEYKRPKFHVVIDTPSEGYQLDQDVTIKGHALSYTGSAIDNAEVKYRVTRKVRYPYWYWWIRKSDISQEISNGSIKTDEKGDFSITFKAKPDNSVNKDDNPIFTYSITADVTDNTGETRSGEQTVRLAYTALKLSINSKYSFNADDEFEFTINSSTHNDTPIPAEGKIKIYALQQPDKPTRYSNNRLSEINSDKDAIRKMQEGKICFEDRFQTDETGNCTKKIKLPEGIYRIKAESEDRFGKEVKAQNEVVALSNSSKKNTIKLPFIFKIITENVRPGNTFKAFWGTGYNEGPAFIEICHENKVLKSYWTDSKKNKEFITFPVTENMRGGFYVKVFQVKDNSFYNIKHFVDVAWSNKDLELKLVHFTSKMEPNAKESWKVEISGEDAEFRSIEMLASMYDASLDSFIKHNWERFNIFYKDINYINCCFSNNYARSFNLCSRLGYRRHYIEPVRLPSFPDYIIQDFYGYRHIMTLKSTKTAPPMPSRPAEKVEEKPAVQDYSLSDSGANKSDNQEETDSQPDIDLSNIKARANLNETAFFMPQLTVNDKGVVSINFDAPEALTTWKFMGFAHGTRLQNGLITQTAVTQKELMIQPNAPRFLREGDKIAFTVKVTNLSDKEQSGAVALELLDAVTDENRNAEFKNNGNKKSFTIPAKQSRGFSWLLDIPYKPGFVKYKAVGATKTHSDGEEGLLPILSSRILVLESLPLPINGPAAKDFKFEKLIKSGDSKTLEQKALTVEMTSNPAWYAIQALPYLIEFPHECSEQTFNRIYANKLAQHIANSDPKIRRIFDIWAKDEFYNKGTALISNLEKNQHLKAVTLMETPWLLDAKSETEDKHKIGILFQKDRLNREIESATLKLKNMQYSDGSFSWFPDGESSTYLTLYIMTGYGRLQHLGLEIDLLVALKALDFVDNEIVRYYNEIINDENFRNNNYLSSTIALYLYGRSFFLKQRKIPSRAEEAVNFFLEQAKKNWLALPYRMSQAHLALALNRFGDRQTALDITNSIKERSVTNEEMGRFWRENEISYSWNRAEIETQAMMIELFSEVTHDEKAVEECKIWLLKQKQTQHWKTTKATADAIYALILRGCDLLASDKIVKVSLDNKEVKPEKVEAGTGYYQKIYSPAEIKPQMGNIQVKKEDKGVAWGAVHWQYIEDMSKVTPFENNLKLKKTLFVKTNTEKGPTISPVTDGKLKVGDLVVVRIELRTDRDLEFVHMKDQRGSGMEPVNVLSRYKRQDGFGYYEATKDTASHFYIDYLPKGTYVFEYEVRVQLAGQYQSGIAEIMCMYAPEFNSHSQSFLLNVE